MRDEHITEGGDAAIRAAIQILSDAQRRCLPEPITPLPPVAKPRTVRIGGAEFELDKLSLLVVVILVGMYGVMALAYVRTQSFADREDGALNVLTAPDVSLKHLVSQGGFAANAQGTYWGRDGIDIAVLTLSNLPPVSGGTRYQWSALHGDHWITLSGGTLDAADTVRLMATSPDLLTAPDAIRVTLQAADADPALVERTVLSWPNH